MIKPKILVIPNDPMSLYDAKGYSDDERNKYFNPNSEFDVSLLGVEETSDQPFGFAGFTVYPSNRNLDGIERIMDTVKPKLVRGYNGNWSAKLAAQIGNRYEIPSITSVHNLLPSSEVTLVDKVICVSEAAARKCMKKGADQTKIEVIYDGVNLEVFKDRQETEEVATLKRKYNSQHRIVSVGRLTWEKNLENLLRASNLVRESLPDLTHIHIGNSGDQKASIEKLMKDLDMEHFHLLPNVSQDSLPDYYSWANVFAMASVSEGFGLVYIEALACKTPVVTSNLPPLNMLVRDHYNGVLVNPHDPLSIAEGITTVLTDQSLQRKLSQNARQSVQRFDIEEMKELEARLYKKILGKHK